MGKVPAIVERGRMKYRRMSADDGMNLRYELREKATKARQANDLVSFLNLSLQGLELIEKQIAKNREVNQRYGTHDHIYSHEILDACRVLPIVGARDQLEEIRELVTHYPDFDPGLFDFLDRTARDFETVQELRVHISQNPGTKQNLIKKEIGYDDGRHLSTILKDMEAAGQIERRKSDKTYELFIGQKSSIADKVVAPKPKAPQNPDPIPTIKGGESKRRPWWKRR